MASVPLATRGQRTGIESVPVESQFKICIGEVCVPAVVSLATMKYEYGVAPVPPMANAPMVPPFPAILKLAVPLDTPAIKPAIPSPGKGDRGGVKGFDAGVL